MAENKKLYVAVDIEKAGPMYSHALLALGVTIGTQEDGIIETKRWCFNERALYWGIQAIGFRENKEPSVLADAKAYEERMYRNGHFDRSTWTEFWLKNVGVLKMIYCHARNADEEWEGFLNYLDGLEDRFADHDIVIVTDHPSFDVAHINYQLEKRFGRNPINRTKSGRYCMTMDPTERLVHSSLKDEIYAHAEQIVVRKHDTRDDSMGILYLMLASLEGSDPVQVAKRMLVWREKHWKLLL